MSNTMIRQVSRFQHETPARLQPLAGGAFRVSCGQGFPDVERDDGALRPCPQRLGSAHCCAGAPELLAAAAAIAEHAGRPPPSPDDWVLRAERGQYTPDAGGRYRIAHHKRPESYRRRWSWREPVGRRPMPAALRAAGLATGLAGAYGVVGHLPVLPATVVCPRCGQPNRVEVPPTAWSPPDAQPDAQTGA